MKRARGMSLYELRFNEESVEQSSRVEAVQRCSHRRGVEIPTRDEDSTTKETNTTKVLENQNG